MEFFTNLNGWSKRGLMGGKLAVAGESRRKGKVEVVAGRERGRRKKEI